ncbi:MAG TPA: hypothetical protein DEP66_01215, partial [Acidimicrobiaceae bacterium]|nr:hypothetical protein [Acidimicrobiaceae bacterium]
MRVPMRALARPGVAGWIEIVVVVGCCAVVFVWLGPSNIFSDTTPTGGDMGAHVWAPAYLRDHLLPNWQLRGWSPDWYAGFPAMQFYMVLPYLMIVAVDVVLPYGVAFKLVAVSGVVALPAAAWAMARLARWSRPLPELFAVAALLFAFDVNFTIYGGNIASTLAGEFAFALGLSTALVYVGLLVRSLDTGVGRARASIALAVVALCHPVTLAFAVAVSVIVVAVRALHRLPDLLGRATTAAAVAAVVLIQVVAWNTADDAVVRLAALAVPVAALLLLEARRAWWALTIGLVGGALSAFWTYPFFARRSFLNDMGWEKITAVRTSLFFPDEASGDAVRHPITWVLALAAVAAIVGLARRHRPTLTLTAVAAATGLAFVHWPQHRLWNARVLPFWYLSLYLLAAVGVWMLADALIRNRPGRSPDRHAGRRPDRRPDRHSDWRAAAVPAVAAVLAVVYVGLYLGVLPLQRYDGDAFRWGPLTVSADDRSFVRGWANWNFTGYEGRTGYPVYYDLVEAMADVGERHGCGTALWEYGSDELGSYGTPMAPMLLPHWTDGCIGSMEGLYFESSPTVPFHFLMQSELSQNPSRPMRGLPYGPLDVDLGVAHMQLSGVRYYAAFTTAALKAAERNDALTAVAWAGPWTVYRVADSELVVPLRYEPAVAVDAPEAGRAWTDPAVIWFNDRAAWDVPIAADGPDGWARVALLPAPAGGPDAPAGGDVSSTFTRFAEPARRAVAPATVSDVRQ